MRRQACGFHGMRLWRIQVETRIVDGQSQNIPHTRKLRRPRRSRFGRRLFSVPKAV